MRAWNPRFHPRTDLVVFAGLVALAAAVYGQAIGFSFIGMDDKQYLTQNPWVRGGLSWEGLRWALTNTGYMYWHPVTWLAFMAEVEAFGVTSAGAHFVNLAIHTVNAFLVYRIVRRLTGSVGVAVTAAALFCVHPLQVESVAWVAERKTLLCALLALLAVVAYLERYAVRPGLGPYLLVAGLFTLAMAAKPAVAPLPLVLLALDVWIVKRARSPKAFLRLLAEKLPLLALGAALSAVALGGMEAKGMRIPLETVPWSQRLLEAAASWGAWVGRILAPVGLSFWYPPPSHLGAAAAVGVAVLLGLVSVVSWSRLRFPAVAVGFSWYAVMLFPGLGLERGGAWPFAADRFQYVALAGFFLAASEGLRQIFKARALRAGVAVAAVALLGWTSWLQTSYWAGPRRLFGYVVSLYPEDAVALNNLGLTMARDGAFQTAVTLFNRALEIDPCYTSPRRNLAIAWAAVGNLDKAFTQVEALEACGREPVKASLLRARLLEKAGRYAEAEVVCREVLRQSPENGEARLQLGRVFLFQGNAEEAEDMLRAALEKGRAPPGAVFRDLGAALLVQGKDREALDVLRKAVRFAPSDPDLLANLGLAWLRLDRCEKAAGALSRALRIDPEHAAARANLRLLRESDPCKRSTGPRNDAIGDQTL